MMRRNNSSTLVVGLAAALMAGGLSASAVPVGADAGANASTGELTTTFGSTSPAPGARTIPYFSDSFSSGGVTYPYKMVGTNPRTSSATTTVPTVIVPLRFVFADGSVSDPGTTPSAVVSSPLFQGAKFTSGRTQYGDAMRRAMFWNFVAATDYHVLLGQPVVLPAQTLNVPQGQGVYLNAGDPIGPPSFGVHVAVATGVVSSTWFAGGGPSSNGAFGALLASLKLDPATVPIVLSRNVTVSTSPIPFGLPLVGFHSVTPSTAGNGSQQVQTSIWASYADPNWVVEFPNIVRNIHVLSHEVSEWLHDPFISNTVPAWRSPRSLPSAFYGCSSLLETGDPVVDVAFDMNRYQLSDEAFFSWFAHQTPSIGINGQYTYLGTFTEPSPHC
jgi:hypothetical protein